MIENDAIDKFGLLKRLKTVLNTTLQKGWIEETYQQRLNCIICHSTTKQCIILGDIIATLHPSLLLESLHDSRPMLGAGSSSGCILPGLHVNSVVAEWGRPAGVSVSVHPHIRTLSVHRRWVPISAYVPCLVRSLSGGDLGLTSCVIPQSNLEVAIPWGWRRA